MISEPIIKSQNLSSESSKQIEEKSKINSHLSFLELKRKSLKLKEKSLNYSKYRIDSINKRVKAKFFTMLYQTMSLFVTKKLPKLPQKIVTNVSIKFNKELLTKPIKQIFRETVLFPSDEEFKEMIPNSMHKEFFDILNTSFSEAFENYLSCPIFKKHLKDILKKNGGDYKDTFEEECRGFVDYYSASKPKKIEDIFESFKDLKK